MAAKTPFLIEVPEFLTNPLMTRFCPTLRNYPTILRILFDETMAAESCALFDSDFTPYIVVEQRPLLEFVTSYKKVLDEELPKPALEDKKWNYETFAEEAKRTRNPQLSIKDRLINNAFGLSGEVGEFVDLMKKALFHGTEVPREKIVKELGDIQYYWMEAVSTLGEQFKMFLILIVRSYEKDIQMAFLSRRRTKEKMRK
jgi:hypothetical protein